MLGYTNVRYDYKGYYGDGIDEWTDLLLTGDEFKDKSDNHYQIDVSGDISIDEETLRDGRPTYLFGTLDHAMQIPIAAAPSVNHDWTIEYWLQPITCATSSCVYHQYGTHNSNHGLIVGYNSGANTWYRGYYIGKENGTAWQHNNLSIGTLTKDNWHHCAWSRSNNTIYRFLNGSLAGSTAYSLSLVVPAYKPEIGRYAHNTVSPSFRLQDFRISSTGRYIADFTPPERFIN